VALTVPVPKWPKADNSADALHLSRARDSELGPTLPDAGFYFDCPSQGIRSVGVTWPTSMPGVTDVLMSYFVLARCQVNVTAFSDLGCRCYMAFFARGGPSHKRTRRAPIVPTTSLVIPLPNLGLNIRPPKIDPARVNQTRP